MSAAKAESDTFKGVYASKKIDGKVVQFITIQIAASIARCKIDTSNNAENFLSWLVEKKVLFSSHLREAMDNLEPPIKYRLADMKKVLIKNIVESMGGRELVSRFSTEHLSQVLTASVSGTLKSMLSYVQRLKAINSKAFKELKQGENGARYTQEHIAKIANSIAKCNSDGVTNAQGRLSWLVVSYIYIPKFYWVAAVGHWSFFNLKHLHTRLTSMLWGNAGKGDTGKRRAARCYGQVGASNQVYHFGHIEGSSHQNRRLHARERTGS